MANKKKLRTEGCTRERADEETSYLLDCVVMTEQQTLPTAVAMMDSRHITADMRKGEPMGQM
jgi:hypothetical protein